MSDYVSTFRGDERQSARSLPCRSDNVSTFRGDERRSAIVVPVELDEKGGVRKLSENAVPTGYLDTCLVSGLAEFDLRPGEQTALQKILEAHDQGRIALCTSHVTKQELNALSDEKRQKHDVIYSLLEKVPVASEGYSTAPLGAAPLGSTLLGGGPGYEDPLLAELKTILPDANDARHLFQAMQNGVDYFITDDERTIVSRASEIEGRYTIKVRLPSQLLAELE